MRPRLSFDERRADILRAATRVIARNGVHGLRIQDVAEEAGISQPLVSRHFRSREQLILEAFVRADERALDILSEVGAGAGNGMDRLRATLEAALRPDERLRESWSMWREILAFGTFVPEISAAVLERQRRFVALIAEIVHAGRADGSMRTSTEPGDVGLVAIALLDGFGISLRYGVVDRAKALALMDATLAAWA